MSHAKLKDKNTTFSLKKANDRLTIAKNFVGMKWGSVRPKPIDDNGHDKVVCYWNMMSPSRLQHDRTWNVLTADEIEHIRANPPGVPYFRNLAGQWCFCDKIAVPNELQSIEQWNHYFIKHGVHLRVWYNRYTLMWELVAVTKDQATWLKLNKTHMGVLRIVPDYRVEAYCKVLKLPTNSYEQSKLWLKKNPRIIRQRFPDNCCWKFLNDVDDTKGVEVPKPILEDHRTYEQIMWMSANEPGWPFFLNTTGRICLYPGKCPDMSLNRSIDEWNDYLRKNFKDSVGDLCCCVNPITQLWEVISCRDVDAVKTMELQDEETTFEHVDMFELRKSFMSSATI